MPQRIHPDYNRYYKYGFDDARSGRVYDPPFGKHEEVRAAYRKGFDDARALG